MKTICIALAAAAIFGVSSSASSQQPDTATAREVVPGVLHKRIVFNTGPWRVNVIQVDLKRSDIDLVGIRANDRFTGRERLSSMVGRYQGPGKTVAAVNGDFFNVKTGESENNVIIEGDLLKGVRMTDSPYDTFANPHSQFGFDRKGGPHIERYAFSGKVIRAKRSATMDALNFWPDSNALVLYTAAFGDSTPADSAGRILYSIPLRKVGQKHDTLLFRIAGPARQSARVGLARGGALAAGGSAVQRAQAIYRAGGIIRVVAGVSPGREKLRTLIGGWPRIVSKGRNVAQYADIVEGTFPRFSTTRHPRTAVGFSQDSSTLYLVTVDGRRESDSGMSLVELGDLMLRLGAHDAMNFDGGGSTTMVVDGRVVNSPSDKEGERAIGSGLLVIRNPPGIR